MLTTPPVLAAPTPKEPMLLYITATSRVVSIVIVVEHKEEGKALPVQRPVYYLSEVLSASKQNYPHYQKMCYDVHFAAKKLKPYFQEHPITVVCMAPLAEMLLAEWPSGPSSWLPTPSSTSPALPSSPKRWLTPSLTGLKPSTCR